MPFCMYLVFLYLFQVFFSTILYAFIQNLSRQQQIRRDAKPVNFTRRTIENCFVPLVYSFLLSGKFCILKALLFCLYFWLKSSDEAGKNRERARQWPQITVHYCVTMHAH